jgi:MFS family permease
MIVALAPVRQAMPGAAVKISQGPPGSQTHAHAIGSASLQSRFGLNAANFFLAEVTGVVMPFLNDFLQSRQWRYDAIGLATALAGLGVFVMQTPAGFIVDRVARRRTLLAGASLLLGVCYGLLSVVPAHGWLIDPLLFAGIAAVAASLFVFFMPETRPYASVKSSFRTGQAQAEGA